MNDGDAERLKLDPGEAFVGVLDVLVSFVVALEQHGLFDRKQIADVLGRVMQHQQHLGLSASRRYAVEHLMKEFFEAPTRGLTVLEGGGRKA